MSQLILPPNVRKLETASAVAKAAQTMERIAQMGAVGRLMTMLNNPSVPQSLKEDLREVLADLAAYEQHALNPTHALYLTGHRNLADMVTGHIHVWRSALQDKREYLKENSTVAEGEDEVDLSYVDHELAALTAIETCVDAALTK